DTHTEDRAAREFARSDVILAHVIAAVEADTQAITRERELADLRPHRSALHDLVIDVELGCTDGLAVLAALLARELHAKRVLTCGQLLRDKLLRLANPKEVVYVVQFLVLEEERVSAKA